MTEKIIDYGNISVEQIASSVWIVRGHENHEGFGSPYRWVFVLIKEGNRGIAKGMLSLDALPKSQDRDSIRDFCKNNGIDNIEYTRIKSSGESIHMAR